MKILFATPECAPWVKTGGLGDVSGALPAELALQGHDVRVLLPAYAGMKVEGEVGETITVPAQRHWPEAQLLTVKVEGGVTLLLLSCPMLYERPGGPYVAPGGRDHDDNAFRFAFLSRVAATIGTPATPCPDWQADIAHANDWPCGLAPMYLADWRGHVPREQRSASIVTIHNLAFQGVFPLQLADSLEVPWHWRGIEGVEFWGQMSMLKAALQFSDAITTVSPTYAREIQTDEFGVGLQGVLRHRASKLTGILNGIDTRAWSPQGDMLLPHRYNAADMAGKEANKTELQLSCGLTVKPDAMLFGIVSRLTSQKGVDFVLASLDRLLARGAQLVVLGAGEPALQDALQTAAHHHPGSICANLGFNEALAHMIEAGSDSFLMPSRFEPCGLNQMYSQAYGTPPVVNATGGLVDSVIDADLDPVNGSGFVMRTQDAPGFADALTRAMDAFADAPRWQRIQRNGMSRDFGWARSAARYVEVYERALSAARS